MKDNPNRRLLWAARLILAGLGIELVSLVGLKHPWGFLLFSAVACVLIVAGIVLYLAHRLHFPALIKPSSPPSDAASPPAQQ